MKRSEVQELLVYISGTDNRDTTNPLAAGAWHDALDPDIQLADARAAVIHHRRNSPGVYLEVGHINAYVKQIQRDRVKSCEMVPEIPAGLTQAEERAWIRTFWTAVKLGNPDPTRGADAALGVTRPALPPANPARLQALVATPAARGPVQIGQHGPNRPRPAQSVQPAPAAP